MLSRHKNIKAICTFHPRQVQPFLFKIYLSEWLKKDFALNVSLKNFSHGTGYYSSFQMQWHLPLSSSRRNVLPKMAICIIYHSVYVTSELPRHLKGAKGVFINCIAFWHMFWVVISMYIKSSIIEWPKLALFRYFVDNTFTSFKTWFSKPPLAQQHEMWHEYVLI
jgi:hypothetical protein